MSRRRGEFEHRTSIFEGAFRAWSHLGGLEPNDLENLPVEQLDPLGFVIENDPRLAELERERDQKKSKAASNTGGGDENNGETKDDDEAEDDPNRRLYPYEPLPRSGLSHPFVQAILSPWLGPDAEHDAIQLGLTTLRTWWQHRRKGESGSAVVALGTQKMRGVVDGYTRHFFNLAFCLVIKDGEQPPRSLMSKMKEVEKVKNKKVKKRAREEETGKLTALALNAGLDHGIDPPLSQEAAASCVLPPPESPPLHCEDEEAKPQIKIREQCMPGKVDLPGLVQQISSANQLVHRGNVTPLTTLSNVSTSFSGAASSPGNAQLTAPPVLSSHYSSSSSILQDIGNPSTFPVVFISEGGDVLLLLSIDGITCAHCIKIVETVLKGCDGTKSPITGLIDATADQSLKLLIIKIDLTLHAKRIAYEATRNLSMVGYVAKTLEVNLLEFFHSQNKSKEFKMDSQMICTAFEIVGSADPSTFFDWERICRCSPLGVEKEVCPRHNQMNAGILECFQKRKDQIMLFMNNCTGGNGNELEGGPNALSNSTTANAEQQPQQQPSSSNRGGGGISLLRRNSRLRQSVTSEPGFGRAMSGLSALSIDWENMEDFDVNIDHSSHINNTNLSEPIAKKSECCGGGNSTNNNTATAVDDDGTAMGMQNGCAMIRGGDCDCGPTCACVGCPIHDKHTHQDNVLRSFPKRPSILRKSNPESNLDNTTTSVLPQGGMQVSFKT